MSFSAYLTLAVFLGLLACAACRIRGRFRRRAVVAAAHRRMATGALRLLQNRPSRPPITAHTQSAAADTAGEPARDLHEELIDLAFQLQWQLARRDLLLPDAIWSSSEMARELQGAEGLLLAVGKKHSEILRDFFDAYSELLAALHPIRFRLVWWTMAFSLRRERKLRKAGENQARFLRQRMADLVLAHFIAR